jgi:hypothetical protein
MARAAEHQYRAFRTATPRRLHRTCGHRRTLVVLVAKRGREMRIDAAMLHACAAG